MLKTVQTEITELEEQLRQADLNPDSDVFANLLDDRFVMMVDGKICSPKQHIVEMHKPVNAQKFESIKIEEMKIVEQGDTAIVTCVGHFEGEKGNFSMNFMRVWLKKAEGWKIIAGAMTHLKGE